MHESITLLIRSIERETGQRCIEAAGCGDIGQALVGLDTGEYLDCVRYVPSIMSHVLVDPYSRDLFRFVEPVAWFIRCWNERLAADKLLPAFECAWTAVLEQFDGTCPFFYAAFGDSPAEAALATPNLDIALNALIDPMVDRDFGFFQSVIGQWSNPISPRRALTVLDFSARVRATNSDLFIYRCAPIRTLAFFDEAALRKLWRVAEAEFEHRFRGGHDVLQLCFRLR